MASGRPSINPAFHERIERYLRERPELGFRSTGELVSSLLREWLDRQEEKELRSALARGGRTAPEPVFADSAP